MTAKNRIKKFIKKCKRLEGDPHHIGLGMGIGIFVSFTPTLPFHTLIAVTIAILLRGNKIAAAIGVWFSNPFTIPFFYLGTYKVGTMLFNNSKPFDTKYGSIKDLLGLGWDATIAMMAGGIILGIPFSIAAYFITRKIFFTIQLKKKLKKKLLT
ncbi:uncharacterized protein BuS5_02603 [Desulfosarcina sp. BuS5]|uniref:DUF2062 domain-containing protein n=1 Tax=Desulfosarcina sp. BuS5 TaxID=933262 RepID=UPI00068858B9|nr:DUF2062 domain-containing protein [Desulfosarcina sp. BuS5]WDN89635.1 uncharacterized protein BuS5_02603 [Desulfosarcina sp. BuS5]